MSLIFVIIYIYNIYIYTYCSLNPPTIIINKSSFIHEIAIWVKLETNNHFLNLPNDDEIMGEHPHRFTIWFTELFINKLVVFAVYIGYSYILFIYQ